VGYTGTSGGPAERAGVPLGTRLVSVAGRAVASNADVVALIRQVPAGETMAFEVVKAPVRSLWADITSGFNIWGFRGRLSAIMWSRARRWC
jgi:S1-C subfamily serine protease